MAAYSFTRSRLRSALVVLGLGAATAAVAQTAGQAAQSPAPSSVSALRLPQNPVVFGASLPAVVKATAIVNGEVITQTDVEQRLALLAIANEGEIPTERLDELRQQRMGRRFRAPNPTGSQIAEYHENFSEQPARMVEIKPRAWWLGERRRGLAIGSIHELAMPGIRSADGLPLLHNTGYYTLWNLPKE